MIINRNFLLTIFLVFLVGCEKDKESEKEIDDPEEQTVNVIDVPKVYFGNRGIVIEWKPTDITGFSNYEVLRSTDGKYFHAIYGTSILDSTLYDVNHTTFTDIVYPFVDSIYYKIVANGIERIESPKAVLAIPDPMELDFDPLEGYIIPNREEILFYKNDWRGPKFSWFDYKKGTIKKELELKVEVTGFIHGFGKFKGNYECYFYDNMKPKMDIYDAISFDYKTSFGYDKRYSYITSDNSNFLYYHEFWNIFTVNRNTFATQIYEVNKKVYLQKVYYMEGQNKLLGTTLPAGVYLFELGDSGTITSEFHKYISNSDYVDYIQGTKYISATSVNDFKIINTDNWEEKRLLNEYGHTLYPSFLYAKNGVLYACRGSMIYCYSLDNLKLIEYIPTRIEPHMLLSNDKDLILIATKYDRHAIIDTMKLSK